MAEIKTRRVTEQNSNFGYDIDGISGIINSCNSNWLKKPVKINFKKNSIKKICNNGRIIQFDHGFAKLKSLLHLQIGTLELSVNERIEFYIFINKPAEAVIEKEFNIFRTKLEVILKKELSYTMKSSRLLGFRRFYRNLGLNSSSENINGYFDDSSFLSFLNACDTEFYPNKTFVYFEVYNVKHIFNSSNYDDVFYDLSRYFDLNNVVLDLDMCTSIYVKNDFSHSLFFPKNFLDAESSTRYTLFNCDYLNSFNFKTTRLNARGKGRKVKLSYNGIAKINFYNEAVRIIIPKSLTKIKFPRFSTLRALQNYFGNDYSLKLTSKFKTYLQELKDVATSCNNFIDMPTTVRMEMTIKSFNVGDYHKEIMKVISKNVFYEIETSKVRELICTGCAEIFKELTKNKTLSYIDVAKLVYHEILYFEFCIRGGKNLHILPKSLNLFLARQNNELRPFCIDNTILISNDDAFAILEKLLINSKFLIPSLKGSMMETFDFLK